MEITLELLSRVFQEEEHNMKGINYPFIDMCFLGFTSLAATNTDRPVITSDRDYGTNIETEDMTPAEKATYYQEKNLQEKEDREYAREAYRNRWKYYN